jgi:hypothetical protein
MANTSRRAIVLGLMLAAGTPVPGRGGGTLAAQTSGPCALLTIEEVEPLADKSNHEKPKDETSRAEKSHIAGVPLSVEGAGFSSCRYLWGSGIHRYELDVTVGDASRAFSGMMPDQITQWLRSSVIEGTADAVIPDVGDSAVFKADSPVNVHATALLKGRLLQVHVGGRDARDEKDYVIKLLKSAATRL